MKWFPRVHSIRDLTDSVYVLRFDRNDLSFEPGQYVAVGVKGESETREYSLYSAVDDPFLEILVKEVATGSVSRALRRLQTGAQLTVEGPFGTFFQSAREADAPLLFVATGTGISPFRSIVRSMPDLDYRLIHGIRYKNERYNHADFAPSWVTTCLTRPLEPLDDRGARAFHGRVTTYLASHHVPRESFCCLCGSADMIYETIPILRKRGVPTEQVSAEIYF